MLYPYTRQSEKSKNHISPAAIEEIKTIGIPFKKLKLCKFKNVRNSTIPNNGWRMGYLVEILDAEIKKRNSIDKLCSVGTDSV